MKTFKHLYERICTFENLALAFRKARRGKRGRPDVAAFEVDQDIELLALQEELVSGTYQPGRYRHFTIYEGKLLRDSKSLPESEKPPQGLARND